MKKLLTLLLCVFLYVPSLSFFFDSNLFEDLYYPNISEEYTVQDLLNASLNDIKVSNQGGVTTVNGVLKSGGLATFVTNGQAIHASVNGNMKNDIWLADFIESGYNRIKEKIWYSYYDDEYDGFQILQGFKYTINQRYAAVSKDGKVTYGNINYKKIDKTNVVAVIAIPVRNMGPTFKPIVVEFDPTDMGCPMYMTLYDTDGNQIGFKKYEEMYTIQTTGKGFKVYTGGNSWDRYIYTSSSSYEVKHEEDSKYNN